MPKTKKDLIEVARSFSRKLNCGNYETVDFFASAKAEVDKDDMEVASEELYAFCKAEVEKSLNAYKIKDFETDGSKELKDRLTTPTIEPCKPTPQDAYNEKSEIMDKEVEAKVAENIPVINANENSN